MDDCTQHEFVFVELEAMFDAITILLCAKTVPWDHGVEYYSMIPAIKHVRMITGWPLKESKEYVDNVIDNDIVLKKRFNR
jgi:hypothetical protein